MSNTNFKMFYMFNPNTYDFEGIINAQQSPLEKDVYLKPDNCTDVKPLSNKDGFSQWFDGIKWNYRKSKLEIKEKVIVYFKLNILSLCFEFKITFPF